MPPDTPLQHFGNFYRSQFPRRGSLAYACRRTGANYDYILNFIVKLDTPESIMPETRDVLAKTAGFVKANGDGDWEALERAWQTTNYPPFTKIGPPNRPDPGPPTEGGWNAAIGRMNDTEALRKLIARAQERIEEIERGELPPPLPED